MVTMVTRLINVILPHTKKICSRLCVCLLCTPWPFSKWCNRLVYWVSYLWMKASTWMNRSISTRFTSVTFSEENISGAKRPATIVRVCMTVCAHLRFKVFCGVIVPITHTHSIDSSVSFLTHGKYDLSLSLVHVHTQIRAHTHIQCLSTGVNRCSSHMAMWTPDLRQPEGSKCKCHC